MGKSYSVSTFCKMHICTFGFSIFVLSAGFGSECVSSFLYVLLFYSIDWTSTGISFFLLFILLIIYYGISVYLLR